MSSDFNLQYKTLNTGEKAEIKLKKNSLEDWTSTKIIFKGIITRTSFIYSLLDIIN